MNRCFNWLAALLFASTILLPQHAADDQTVVEQIAVGFNAERYSSAAAGARRGLRAELGVQR